MNEETTRHCVCGKAVEERELPRDLHRLSGRTSILVHAETMSSRCFPDSDNQDERNAKVKIDELHEGTNRA
ncbi:MAG: hypothetical protein HIU84_11900 [Acidobacteria bacterium]|nr:hypothetical protein [Acidobacteriota bacterium]